MGTKGITEGHEKTATGASWQSDGLRDSDVLSSATLTNFNQRALMNGVLPITMTNYASDAGGSDRNNPIVGNCVVRKNTGGGQSQTIFVDAGVASLDGMFYTVGSASSINITTAGLYNPRYNAGFGSASLPTAVGEEVWVLVIVDPELNGNNNVGYVCGQKVQTSSGLYPQYPSSHLVKQSVVLAAVRLTNQSVVAAVEDKRVFVRGGPMPLTKLQDANGATYPHNQLFAGITAANLPHTGLGLLFTRNPAGHHTSYGNSAAQGNGGTHLFYQADTGVGVGHAHQLTPVHRQHKQGFGYGGAGNHNLLFAPLLNEQTAGQHLLTATWFSANAAQSVSLMQGVHYNINAKVLTMLNLATTATNPHTSAGVANGGTIVFDYVLCR